MPVIIRSVVGRLWLSVSDTLPQGEGVKGWVGGSKAFVLVFFGKHGPPPPWGGGGIFFGARCASLRSQGH